MDGKTKSIIKWVAGIFVGGGVTVGILAFGAMTLGLITVSARPPHWPITMFALHYTFKHSVAQAGSDVPVPDDLNSPERIALGIQHYKNVCTSCHGGPGLGQSPIALSMRPRPQHLASVIDQFSDQQLYAILRNGVRFSAMPAWPADSNFDEIWSVIAFLRAQPDMSTEEFIQMTARSMPEGAQKLPFQTPVAESNMDVGIKAPPMDEYKYAHPGTGWHEYASNGEVLQVCVACHGDNGNGAAAGGRAPNLTVLTDDYIKHALEGYADGSRPSGIMMTVAASLSDGQMDQLAGYFSGMDTPSQPPATQTGNADAGRQIALNGKPEAAVPACYNCHQNIEQSSTLWVPQIAGQTSNFINYRLKEFSKGGWIGNGPWKPMGFIASALTPQDHADLAAYFSTQTIGESAPALTSQDQNVDLVRAEELAKQVCAECHTESGEGTSTGAYPNLTLQTPTYLRQQLHAFRQGLRTSERMQMVAEKLSEDEIRSLAVYFGEGITLPTPQPDEPFATGEEIARGQQIAENGIPDKNIPACLTCHGAEPTSKLQLTAHLNGLAGEYIKSRLQHLGSQTNDDLYSLSPMHNIARDMDVDERHDVAAWFAAQEPLPK